MVPEQLPPLSWIFVLRGDLVSLFLHHTLRALADHSKMTAYESKQYCPYRSPVSSVRELHHLVAQSWHRSIRLELVLSVCLWLGPRFSEFKL